MNLSDEHAGMDEMGDWWDLQVHNRSVTNLDNTMTEASNTEKFNNPDVERHLTLRDRIGQVIHTKLAEFYRDEIDASMLDQIADAVVEQIRNQYRDNIGKEQVIDAMRANMLDTYGYDAHGKRAITCMRSTSDPQRDHQIMESALELTQAITLRNVAIDAATLYKHVVGKTDFETVRAVESMKLLDDLRSREGWSVTIICDNPDFDNGPNCIVEVYGEWYDPIDDASRVRATARWCATQFKGNSLLETLNSAKQAMYASFEKIGAMSKTE